MRRFILGTVVSLTVLAAPVTAQEVTLRLHQFLPATSTIPAKALQPWAEKVERESGGRIKVQHFPTMQLGGKPPELYDQAKDGVVDLIWTVLGYTPGRFPKTEAFELPFMVTSGEATSRAFHEFVEKHAMDEFQGVKPIVFHTHGPGLFHSKMPISKLEDLKGKRIRGGSRMINELLKQLEAVPVGMPVPAVPEALSKGVIDGTTIPWQVTRTLKVPELVSSHTNFSGKNGLYTLTFIFAMNKAAYDALPPDLQKVIDENSGSDVAAEFGRAMDEDDMRGKAEAEALGNSIILLDESETARWRKAAAPVKEQWVKEMQALGVDGEALASDAAALIKKYTKQK